MSLETVTILLAALNGAFLVGTPLLLRWVSRGTLAAAKFASVTPTSDQMKTIEQMALMAINFTQEQASKFLKGLVKDGPTTPEQKLEVALGAMQKLTKQADLPLSDEAAKIAIEATLAATRNASPASLAAPTSQASQRPPPPPPVLSSMPPAPANPFDTASTGKTKVLPQKEEIR